MKRIFRGEEDARGSFLEEKRTQEETRGSKRIEDFLRKQEEARGRKRTEEEARG